MRVRLMASRISAMIAISARMLRRPGSVGDSRRRRGFVPRQHHVRHSAHYTVEQFDGQTDGAWCGRGLAVSLRGCSSDRNRVGLRARCKRSDKRAVVPAGNSSPASIAAIISAIWSIIPKTPLTRPASGTRRPARTSARASSAAWLRASSRGNSKKPQFPFTV